MKENNNRVSPKGRRAAMRPSRSAGHQVTPDRDLVVTQAQADDMYGDVSMEEMPEDPILELWIDMRIWVTKRFGVSWKSASVGQVKVSKVLLLALSVALSIGGAIYEFKKLHP